MLPSCSAAPASPAPARPLACPPSRACCRQPALKRCPHAVPLASLARREKERAAKGEERAKDREEREKQKVGRQGVGGGLGDVQRCAGCREMDDGAAGSCLLLSHATTPCLPRRRWSARSASGGAPRQPRPRRTPSGEQVSCGLRFDMGRARGGSTAGVLLPPGRGVPAHTSQTLRSYLKTLPTNPNQP